MATPKRQTFVAKNTFEGKHVALLELVINAQRFCQCLEPSGESQGGAPYPMLHNSSALILADFYFSRYFRMVGYLVAEFWRKFAPQAKCTECGEFA